MPKVERTHVELGAMGLIGFSWGVARRFDFITVAVIGFCLGAAIGSFWVENE